MADMLIIVEEIESKISILSKEAITLGRNLADQKACSVIAVVLGKNPKSVKDDLGKYGVNKAYMVEGLKGYSQSDYIDNIKKVYDEIKPEIVISGTSSRGREYLPMLSMKINSSYVAEAMNVDIQNDIVCKRPIFTGKLYQHVKVDKLPVLIALKPKSIEIKTLDNPVSTEIVEITSDNKNEGMKVIDIKQSATKKIDLQTAEIIVSGGRGVGSGEQFKIIEDFADFIGAASAASRTVVDAGWRDHSMQVGQTGKIVSPKLYIACGISGAIQHIVGMQGSKYIISINKDPEAPIFKKSDYGVVADLFKFLPALKEEISKN